MKIRKNKFYYQNTNIIVFNDKMNPKKYANNKVKDNKVLCKYGQ